MENNKFINYLKAKIKIRENELDSELKELRIRQKKIELLRKSVETIKEMLEIENRINAKQIDAFPEKPSKLPFVKNGELSYAEIAEKVLKFCYQEMTVPELFHLIMEKGYTIKGIDPKNTLRGVLSNYKKIFYKTKDAKWGLLEWNKT